MPGTPGPGKSRSVMHWCEPEWHFSQEIPADYLILPLPENRILFSGFATCALHVPEALEIVFEKVSKVTIHRVNSRA